MVILRELFYKKILVFSLTTIIGIIICFCFLSPIKLSIFDWIFHAVIYMIIFVILFIFISFIFFKEEIKFLKKYLKAK